MSQSPEMLRRSVRLLPPLVTRAFSRFESQVVLNTPLSDEPFEIVPVDEKGDDTQDPTSLSSKPDEETETPVDLPDVTTVVIRKKDKSPITPEDVTRLEVIACPGSESSLQHLA